MSEPNALVQPVLAALNFNPISHKRDLADQVVCQPCIAQYGQLSLRGCIGLSNLGMHIALVFSSRVGTQVR